MSVYWSIEIKSVGRPSTPVNCTVDLQSVRLTTLNCMYCTCTVLCTCASPYSPIRPEACHNRVMIRSLKLRVPRRDSKKSVTQAEESVLASSRLVKIFLGISCTL